ncbi:MFS transporter [Rhodococcus sp. 06-412-2C]|uniref:MDR family MFS transporter n=1 Tax=unclassified Rhodococcus (in: high G+C Gram-positive bacteria) TaxID=192944 RepID=UPI000B9AF668|nr:MULTISPECIES: MDR family MFS transporter [unclassified Rhodococcus (in: high G+C Gram-positive bacteria)]OZC84130.1 MFS transporter [Rhodococcus sp. 06-412-2C]OZC94318.1 MFS transporter [Rhodococcus sp. 06-412-2B]
MATTESTPDIGFRSERGPILIALMLSSSLVALDATIIATAVLTIVGDLGGFAQFPWLFSIYLLAQAVSVPLYGKLSDLFGRKKIMLFGIAMFCLGSILCGLAWSMPALIAFRAIQGLGAGAVQPMSITIAGDIYTLAERAKVQGYLASVWAISSVLGPALGGVFSEFLSWRWIFFINIPLCALAAFMLLRKFEEGAVERAKPKIDYLGAALLTVGATMVLLGLLEGGQSWAWDSPISIAIFVVGFLLLAVFAWVESRADEPILPLWVFTRRVLVVSSFISLLVGALILGLTSYVPTFVQGVFGTGAIVAGFSLSTLTLGWPIAASQSGRVYLRFGFRTTAVVGGSIGVVGAALTTLLDAESQIWHVAAMCFVIGLGMGLIASPTLIAAQSSVDWAERGVVTSTNMFARSLGSAVGVAVFGAIVNARVSGDPEPEQLSDAIHLVFIGVLVAAVLMTVAAVLMPKRAAK